MEKHIMDFTKMNNRVQWIDVGKGIGILLVILGHSFRDSMRSQFFVCNYIYEWVYTFHMPFLMFLSGYTFMYSLEKYERRGFVSFAKGKIKHLFKPYIVYGVSVFIIVKVCFLSENLERVLVGAGYVDIGIKTFFAGLVLGENPYSFHLWYIYSLLLISIIAFGIILLIKKASVWKYYRLILLIISAICFAYSLTHIDQESQIAVLSSTRSYLPWYCFGIIFQSLDEENFNNKKCLYICGAISFIMIGVLPYFGLKNFPVIYRIVRYILILLTIMFLTGISKRLSSFNFLQYIGRKSMPIYLFHQPFIEAGVGIIFFDIIGMPVGACIVLAIVASLGLPILLDSILNRTGLQRIIF